MKAITITLSGYNSKIVHNNVVEIESMVRSNKAFKCLDCGDEWVEHINSNQLIEDDVFLQCHSDYTPCLKAYGFNKLIKIAEKLGWQVDFEKYTITFYQFTPAGQDFSFTIPKHNLADNIYEYWSGFDPDEESVLWIGEDGHGKRGAPYHIKDVVTDMECAKQMILDLYTATKDIKTL